MDALGGHVGFPPIADIGPRPLSNRVWLDAARNEGYALKRYGAERLVGRSLDCWLRDVAVRGDPSFRLLGRPPRWPNTRNVSDARLPCSVRTWGSIDQL